MANQADVRSLEQLELLLKRIETFRSQLLAEIENVELELRRLTNWLVNDVQGYWADEAVKAERRMTECRDVLTRCMSYVREEERRPCTEEKKRLRKAEIRADICMQKARITKAAMTVWEAERNKQNSKVQRCRDLAESDMLVAIGQLRGHIEQLRMYAGLRSSSFSDGLPAGRKDSPASSEGISRTPEPERVKKNEEN